MGIFSIIGNLGLGDFDESKILDNDSGAARTHFVLNVRLQIGHS